MSKRQKHVYPTDEIAHLWAHKTQGDARNPQGNHRFDGDTIYTYDEPIARHIVAPGNVPIILYRDRTWSHTSNVHQSSVRQSIPPTIPMFTVADIGMYGKVDHPANLMHYKLEINVQVCKLKTARGNSSWIVGEWTRLAKEANLYAKTFRLATRFTYPSPGDRIDAAKRTERAEKLAKVRWDNRSKIEKENNRLALINRDAELAEWDAKNGNYAQEWMEGKRNDIPRRPYDPRIPYNVYGNDPDRMVLARIDGADLETTLGARVPLEHVQRAMPLILRVLASGKEWHTNGHTIHLGHYSVTSIGADGTLIVGCHKFARAEVERIAKMLETLPAGTTTIENNPS